MAPPKNNTNATKAGMRGKGWPKGCERDRRKVAKMRDQLRTAKAATTGGEITITAEARIDTACEWAKVGMLAARWLRLHYDQMGHAERLKYAEAAAKAAESRDRAIAALNLDATTKADIFTLIREAQAASVAATDARPAIETAQETTLPENAANKLLEPKESIQ